MTAQRSAEQRNLKRYMAYRVAAWVQQNPTLSWKGLGELTKIHKSDISHLHYGESSSQKIAMKLARTIGPSPLESFLALSEEWAKTYPDWQPEDPLPDPLTHITLSVDGRWADMAHRYPMTLIRAARAKQLLEDPEVEQQIFMAMEDAWDACRGLPGCAAMSANEWFAEINIALDRTRRGGSGLQRLSEPKIKLLPKG